jgi:hypothetical protein
MIPQSWERLRPLGATPQGSHSEKATGPQASRIMGKPLERPLARAKGHRKPHSARPARGYGHTGPGRANRTGRPH